MVAKTVLSMPRLYLWVGLHCGFQDCTVVARTVLWGPRTLYGGQDCAVVARTVLWWPRLLYGGQEYTVVARTALRWPGLHCGGKDFTVVAKAALLGKKCTLVERTTHC